MKVLGWVRAVDEGFGTSPAGREQLAVALGSQSLSGAAASKIGAMGHYGLIERQSGGGYVVSSLARRILHPQSGEDERLALAEAVKSPTLFGEIFEQMANKPLPSLFENVLHHRFGASTDQAPRIAAAFRESAEQAGLLLNGILSDDLRPAATTADGKKPIAPAAAHAEQKAGELIETPELGVPDKATEIQPNTQIYSVPLDLSGRVAELRLPTPSKQADLEAVSSWIEMLVRMSTKREGLED